MKVLFDHNIPRKLRRRLKAHTVTTAAQMGWAQLANGELIQNAEAQGFDVFLTGDHGIFYQQNHSSRRIPIVLISSTYWPLVEMNVEAIRSAIEAVYEGSFSIIGMERVL